MKIKSDKKKGNGFKLSEERIRLDIRKVTISLVKHWNKLPRDAVNALFVETFKVRLDRALSNLI